MFQDAYVELTSKRVNTVVIDTNNYYAQPYSKIGTVLIPKANVGIGVEYPQYKLDVAGTIRSNEIIINKDFYLKGSLYDYKNKPGTKGQILSSTGSGVVWIEIPKSSDLDGTGTANYITKWSDPNTITDSQIFDNGTNVGIGTTTPTEKLQVEGNILTSGSLYLNTTSLSHQENTDVDTGTETVAAIPIANCDAAFFDFVIKNGTDLRAGTIYAVHDGTNVEYTETSTQDLGDTTDVTLSVDISGGNLRLLATTTSDNWTIKSLIRAI